MKTINMNNLAFDAYGLYANYMEFLNSIVEWVTNNPEATWKDISEHFNINLNELTYEDMNYISKEIRRRGQ